MAAPPQETCWSLIRRAAAGLPEDRNEFTLRYLATVRAYLTSRFAGSPLHSEVDDAVQEVFVACFRAGGALQNADPRRGFRAFLYGVTRNVALHFERSRARRDHHARPAGVDPGEVPADESSLSHVFDREYARAIMRQAADTMAARAGAATGNPAESEADRQRRVEILRLRFHEGVPIRTIAARWDEDPNLLHREFAKASREFKAALREVVGLAERCAPDRLEAECDRLLALLGS